MPVELVRAPEGREAGAERVGVGTPAVEGRLWPSVEEFLDSNKRE